MSNQEDRKPRSEESKKRASKKSAEVFKNKLIQLIGEELFYLLQDDSFIKESFKRNHSLKGLREYFGGCLSKEYIYKLLQRNNLSYIVFDKSEIKELTDEKWLYENHIIKLRSLNDIAEELKCTTTRVRNALTRLKIEKIDERRLQYPFLFNATKEDFLKYNNDCLMVVDIAKMLETTKSAVRYRYKDFGIEPYKCTNKIDDSRYYDNQWLETQIKNGSSAFDISRELNCHVQNVWVQLNKFEIPFPKNQGVSQQEKDVAAFIKSIYFGTVVEGSKKIIYPFQLDIYLPDLNIAFEYNGSYYHSHSQTETKEERNYHNTKTLLCREKGIKLIHLSESDFLHRRKALCDFISNQIGINESVIGARKTVVQKVQGGVVRDFYNENHLQGYTSACSINYALVHNNEIISMMSFAKPRFTKRYDYELIRFASKGTIRVQGAASKLLKAFKNDHEGSLVSYSDNRYSEGSLYKKLGFIHESNIPVRYHYIKGNKLYNRMNFQKKKLPNILETFNPDLTEGQNMFDNGYRRIWDCGKKVWLLGE